MPRRRWADRSALIAEPLDRDAQERWPGQCREGVGVRVPPEARGEEPPLKELAAGHGQPRQLTPFDDHGVDAGSLLRDGVDT